MISLLLNECPQQHPHMNYFLFKILPIKGNNFFFFMLVGFFNGLYCILPILHVIQDQPASVMNTQQIHFFSPCHSLFWRWPFNQAANSNLNRRFLFPASSVSLFFWFWCRPQWIFLVHSVLVTDMWPATRTFNDISQVISSPWIRPKAHPVANFDPWTLPQEHPGLCVTSRHHITNFYIFWTFLVST